MSVTHMQPARGNVAPYPGGAHGKLTVPSGDELTVRTFERGQDVVLVVVSDIDETLTAEHLEPSTLEYATVRGIVRLHGEAVFEEHSVVRFQARGEAEVIQRRAFVRVHTPQPVTLQPDAYTPRVDLNTVDLSGGGMLLAGGERLEIGSELRFEMQLGHRGPTIGGTARVVRVHDGGKRALMFDHIVEGDRERLIRFVFECMRSARAKTRGDWF